MKQKEKKLSTFSVPLGLLDYVNPIFYAITTFMIIQNTHINFLFIIGAIISLIFGLTIPTIKVLVGLGKFKFKMPVNLVFYVNFGILLSGFTLLNYVFNIPLFLNIVILCGIILLLISIDLKTKKFNTIAVLTGAFGYIMLYISLISTALNQIMYIPIILYALAVGFFLSLCLVGIKANLKNPKVHWALEASNILCQGLVSIGTLLLFK